MPWDCSEPDRQRRAASLSLLVAALVLEASNPAGAQPSLVSNRWRLGVFPVANFIAYTSHYGGRLGPDGGVEPHRGLDIAAPLGSEIRNWWAGVVQEVISDGGCGVGLVIRSGPYEHIYCHLAGSGWGGVYRSDPVLLSQGQRVSTGQLIGHVGLSGRTTGPHLHWGVRHQGHWLDPARVLRAMADSRRGMAAAPKRLSPPRVGRSPSGLLQP